ncbi:MAG TPA: hypothetical protein VKN73_05890 [Desulfosalsimonadaceae bacterium]|nr:hypothetical protein [Desulfosalsimonadaceae bacterium]
MNQLRYFSMAQLETVTRAVEMAEELVSNYYKLSSSQLGRLNYDVRTLSDLTPSEIVQGHFAQIVKYKLKRKDVMRETEANDFYKICIQDHSILSTLEKDPELEPFAFLLYIVCHELIHVVRFRRFLQQFNVSAEEKLAEERRVHAKTNEILSDLSLDGIEAVLLFYENWRETAQNQEAP